MLLCRSRATWRWGHVWTRSIWTRILILQRAAGYWSGYLSEWEGEWKVRKKYRDALSDGEKQRMVMAKVFYHRPRLRCLMVRDFLFFCMLELKSLFTVQVMWKGGCTTSDYSHYHFTTVCFTNLLLHFPEFV
jgi:hypothetical protein